MPPKNKEKKKRKKSAKSDGPSLEEKYQQTLQKIDSLQDHLTVRNEIARRSQATSHGLREKIKEASDCIEEEKKNKLDISSDLIRQYKSMQAELTNKICSLESNLENVKEKLLKTQNELKAEEEEKLKIIKEKDDIIAELEYKIEHMESAYENVLHDAFDMLTERFDSARIAWKAEATEIQRKNKARLLEFGLKPLYI
ncbi:coiled-coil domain-containing protein 153-like [Hydractinia symbiolongicarpus]|uniref:coiled-coil domain-containing protein 153-like n=1 Tax=Hydractinia symbiolongicarpus TaxID=13093 RepID=UPI00254E6662|nr:coiled-coil domain-containing protein 153-like [Hydractinia symbiolongicarpus]